MIGAFTQSDWTDCPLPVIGSPMNNGNVGKDYQDDCENLNRRARP
jgi:hypothetical protein